MMTLTPSPGEKRAPGVILSWLPGIGIMSLIAILYSQTGVWLFERFTAADTYYSHGFIVPLVSLFLLWQKHAELKSIPFSPDYTGLILIAAGLLTHFCSIRTEVYFISGFSLIALIYGISLFLFGKTLTRRAAFPILFLVFMVPLPLVALNAVGFPLKMLAADSTAFILKRLLGLPVIQEGSRIISSHGVISIDNPCSGLRSLIAMLAIGSLCAHYLKAGALKKGIIFLSSIPVAVAANILRVVVLSLAVYVYGNQILESFIHPLTGALVFAIELGVFRILFKKLNR